MVSELLAEWLCQWITVEAYCRSFQLVMSCCQWPDNTADLAMLYLPPADACALFRQLFPACTTAMMNADLALCWLKIAILYYCIPGCWPILLVLMLLICRCLQAAKTGLHTTIIRAGQSRAGQGSCCPSDPRPTHVLNT